MKQVIVVFGMINWFGNDEGRVFGVYSNSMDASKRFVALSKPDAEFEGFPIISVSISTELVIDAQDET